MWEIYSDDNFVSHFYGTNMKGDSELEARRAALVAEQKEAMGDKYLLAIPMQRLDGKFYINSGEQHDSNTQTI